MVNVQKTWKTYRKESFSLPSDTASIIVAQLLLVCLLREWNCEMNPAHDISHLEIPFWAIEMQIVTIGALTRHGFISIERSEDASLTLGRNAGIGTIGIP